MSARDAITCDRPNCLAFLLEPPEEYEEDTLDDYAEAWGWTLGQDGHACRACSIGRGPVLERGECPWCGGRVTTRHHQEVCMYCGHLTPHNGPDWDDSGEDQDQGEGGHAVKDTRT